MKTGTSAVQLAAIGDIAEVLPGFSTGGALEHDPRGSHQVVLSRHLVPGLPYVYSETDAFRIQAHRPTAPYELRRGDVLFMSRGTRNVASWIERVPAGTIAPVSFYIIRPSTAIEPGYLAWYLNQRSALRAITDIRTGAGTPLVPRALFRTLRIPLPDMETQQRISALGVAMARERQLIDNLLELTAQMHDKSNEQIARDLLARALANDGD